MPIASEPPPSALGAPEAERRPVTSLPGWAEERSFGSVWRLPGGEVAILWPRHFGPDVLQIGGSDTGRWSSGLSVGSSMLAAFLSWEDCAELERAWDRARHQARGGLPGSVEAARAARAGAAAAVAADRARARALLLRGLRRGGLPPGSAAATCGTGRAPQLLIRWPDGRGWWGDVSCEPYPWPWAFGNLGPTMRVLALGLSADACDALARRAETVEEAERFLRERSLA